MNYKITEFFLPLVQTSLLHVPMSGMVERILHWGASAYKWAPEMITCRGSGDITIWKLSFRYFSLEIGGGGRGGWGRLKSLQSPSSTVPEYGIKFLTSSTTTAVKSRPTSWVHHLFFLFFAQGREDVEKGSLHGRHWIEGEGNKRGTPALLLNLFHPLLWPAM